MPYTAHDFVRNTHSVDDLQDLANAVGSLASGGSITPLAISAFQHPTLIEPGQAKNFQLLGINQSGRILVWDQTTSGNYLRLSSDFGTTFPEWLTGPYDWNKAADAVWLNGKIIVTARDATGGVFHVYTCPDTPPSANMLTGSQASLEDPVAIGWFAGTNCTIAVSNAWAADGTQSLAITSVAGGNMWANTAGSNNIGLVPVTVGQTYSAQATFRAATVARNVGCDMVWLTSAFGLVSTSSGTTTPDSTTVDTVVTNTATAPATAAYLQLNCRANTTAAAGEVHYVDKISIVPGGTPTWGTGRYTWTKVLDLGAGTTNFTTAGFLDSDGTHAWVGTPQDPTAGIAIWTTSDGTTWTKSFGDDLRFRHVHMIRHDPYNANTVWASLGDEQAPWSPLPFRYLKSTNGGTTWASVPGTMPQAVGISFDANYVWLSSDQNQVPPIFAKRDGSAWYIAAPNSHYDIAVPGGGTNVFDVNAFHGVIDPANGVYYCTSPPGAGQKVGLFYLLGRHEGCRMELLDTDALNNYASCGPMYIVNGYVWFGWHKHPVITVGTISAT